MINFDPITRRVWIEPVTRVAPFTQRAGDTYLTILEKLAKFVNEVIEKTNEATAEVVESVNVAINASVIAVNDALEAQTTDNDTKISDLTDFVNSEISDLTEYVNLEVGTVIDMRDEMEGYRNEAEAARDQAEIFSATTAELQDTAVAQLIDTPGSETYTQLNTTFAVVLKPEKFGPFGENETWQTNQATLQAANDAAAALGQRTAIDLPHGRFKVKGVIQDSHVSFVGNGTVLEHPDGMTGHMIEARQFTTTGTITAGSHSLTVTSAANIEVGTVVAITAGRGMSNLQNTLLASAIDATQTAGIALATPSQFPVSGYMVIGSEVIQYTGISSGELTGVTRGVLGTIASSHGVTGPTDAIGVAAHHIAQVVSVSGNTVTLDRPATVGVANAPVHFGIVNPGVHGIRFEGNRQTGAMVHYPVFWPMVGNGHGDDIYAHNAQSSVFLGMGATGNRFGTVTADKCMLAVGIGAAFWMFQSCRDNVVQDLRVVGRMFIGVYIDDRTTLGSPFDGPGEGNHIGRLSIDIPVTVPMNELTEHTIGLLVSGGHRNTVGVMAASGVRTGVVFERGGQSQTWNSTPPDCTGNVVDIFRAQNLYQPWVIDAPGNAVIDANFSSHLAYGVMTGNPYIGHMVGPNGEEAMKFPGGTVSLPGIAFQAEPSMGLYRGSAGMMQTIINGSAITRVTSDGMRMENGKTLMAAVDNTTDIGNKTNSRFRDIRAARYLATGAMATVDLTSAFIAGEGAIVYDKTRTKLILSNGTAWVNLDGSAL